MSCFVTTGGGANQDGFDTVEWAATSPFSSGATALYGSSSLAITAYLAAGAVPDSLRCSYNSNGTGDVFRDLFYQGGALRQNLADTWLEDNMRDASYDRDLLYGHPTEGPFWAPTELPSRYGDVEVPIYHSGGWYDILNRGTIDAFTGLNRHGGKGARDRQRLMMGPWTHTMESGELVYPDSTEAIDEDLPAWYAHCLGGEENGIDSQPRVKYYLMGDTSDPDAPGNEWVTAHDWPVPALHVPFYFLDGGDLSWKRPGSDPQAVYLFDPSNPVPTLGGANLYLDAGPYDQRPVLVREDVLLYKSSVLNRPLAITGQVVARLWVSSSAVDTDFTVKLMDVYPDGRYMLVLDGIIRMRYREGQKEAIMMTPGKIYQAEVDLWSTALVFNSGHRIAVAVSSSNSPRFDVNPNTGGPLPTEDQEKGLVARQVLYQDRKHPSHIILPVVLFW